MILINMHNLQVLSASIAWRQCVELPAKLSSGKAVIVNGKVYCGGGVAFGNSRYIVYCYDLLQENWTSLPPLPIRYFGLGQVGGRLVAIGGKKKNDDRKANDVYTYDERSNKWKQTIPPMPTARDNPGVLSLGTALIVAGGDTLGGASDVVEIFKPDIAQWHTSNPLPTPCCELSLVAIGNTCYAIGGYTYPSYLAQALRASVDDLLQNAIPTKARLIRTGDQSPWMSLTDTPLYQPTATVLAGNLVAVGGKESSQGVADMKEIYIFSPSANSWIYVSDLPAPRSCSAAVHVSPVELLLVGGWCGGSVSTVFKGTVHLNL